ncbi:MAG: hypothetical protein AAF658_11405, partial [Myxococcota bacterium]
DRRRDRSAGYLCRAGGRRMKSVCANCGASLDLTEVTRCAACGWVVFPPKAGPIVVVAHENEEIARQIGEVLMRAGFSSQPVASGSRAVELSGDASAYVVDVGLAQDLMAFQVIEHIRGSDGGAETPVVLVASVYNKTAYKRRPTELYGADDYVEQHHITDMLPAKLCTLLGIDPTGVSDLVSAAETRSANAELEGVTDTSVTKAAYTIVADIALYHQREFEQVAAGHDSESLEEALVEGGRILARMTGIEESTAMGPVRMAFERFVSDMRKDGQ